LEIHLMDEKLIVNRQLAIETAEISGTGAHHGDFHPDGKHIYVGSDEGHCFVINSRDMEVIKVIETGKGHGHTTFVPQKNIAITTNHKDTYVSIIDTNTHNKMIDITVSGEQQNNQKLQSHTNYVSQDGKYYYAFASDNGIFYELDIEELKVTKTLETGGTPIQGVFIDRSGWK
jgi:DNA-binding beta-propeller fold protein YncE